MTEDLELTLVVPVYEEKENIIPFLNEVVYKIEKPHKVLIIYDEDSDSTLEKMEEAKSIHPHIAFVKNSYGTGVINAFKTGYAMADSRYTVAIMADLSDMPETVNEMYRRIQKGYDLVVGSRYVKGGAKVGGPLIKLLLSRVANLSLHLLTGIPTHDMTNAFIMYRRNVLEQIDICSNGGFEISMEIIGKAYLHGYRITEVPTVNRNRTGGKSKFKLLSWIIKYLYWYVYVLIGSNRKRLAQMMSRPEEGRVQ